MPETSTTQTRVRPITCGSAPPASSWLGLVCPRVPVLLSPRRLEGGKALSRPLLRSGVCGLWRLYRNYALRITAERHGFAAHMDSHLVDFAVSLTSLASSPVTSHLPHYPIFPFCKSGTCQLLQDRHPGGFSSMSFIEYTPTSYPSQHSTRQGTTMVLGLQTYH